MMKKRKKTESINDSQFKQSMNIAIFGIGLSLSLLALDKIKIFEKTPQIIWWGYLLVAVIIMGKSMNWMPSIHMFRKRSTRKTKTPLVVTIRRDWYDWTMILASIVTMSIAIYGLGIVLPEIAHNIQHINISVSDSTKFMETFSVCTVRGNTNITECSTCKEYPLEELNDTLRICDITTTNPLTDTTNKTREVTIL